MATQIASDINMREKIANVLRGLAADAVQKANSGHPGMPMGCAEIGSKLFADIMHYDPSDPDWPNRDRLVLSAGHGSMWLYGLLHLSGFDVPMEELKQFRQLGSITPGHPERGLTPGVETTTGPLGQGFGNAVGMALAETMMAETYNTDQFQIVDHYTYCVASDGDLMEGVASEAASLAGHLGLGKLVVFFDNNHVSIDGTTDITFTEDPATRFEAYDWHVTRIDGHNLKEIEAAVHEAQAASERPTLIVSDTHIANGAPTKVDLPVAHGKPLGEEEVEGMKRNLGLPPDETFWVPDDVRAFFEQRRQELSEEHSAWEEQLEQWSASHPDLHERWQKAHRREMPESLDGALEDLDIEMPSATRDVSGRVLRVAMEEVPHLVGGSADLAGSNRTFHKEFGEYQKQHRGGRNIRYGVREHAMGAISNGIAYHGGLRPFCGTFLVFSDYMRPSIRLAALTELPVIYVFTHDSIYVGEDGPTHQPIEQLESLRVMPNMRILRPADEEETRLAWQIALERTEGPTALALTRQKLPHIEKESGVEGARRGGYVVKSESDGDPDFVLIGTGSEVSLAVEVGDQLRERGKTVRIVSVPDRQEFLNQEDSYRRDVLGPDTARRVAIEAGAGHGWTSLVGPDGHVVSMETFGESAPGNEVGRHFGFVAEDIVSDLL